MRFSGVVEGFPVEGHVPGRVKVPGINQGIGYRTRGDEFIQLTFRITHPVPSRTNTITYSTS